MGAQDEKKEQVHSIEGKEPVHKMKRPKLCEDAAALEIRQDKLKQVKMRIVPAIHRKEITIFAGKSPLPHFGKKNLIHPSIDHKLRCFYYYLAK